MAPDPFILQVRKSISPPSPMHGCLFLLNFILFQIYVGNQASKKQYFVVYPSIRLSRNLAFIPLIRKYLGPFFPSWYDIIHFEPKIHMILFLDFSPKVIIQIGCCPYLSIRDGKSAVSSQPCLIYFYHFSCSSYLKKNIQLGRTIKWFFFSFCLYLYFYYIKIHIFHKNKIL